MIDEKKAIVGTGKVVPDLGGINPAFVPMVEAFVDPKAYILQEAMRSIVKHRGSTSGKPPTLHTQTCPGCNRRNVNVYYVDGKWRCKKCLDVMEEDGGLE